MIDGAKIAIRPDSRLRIEEYAYTPAAAGGTVSANDDKTVMNLVKGGFRTITGAIGKEADDEYEVRTAVGVLGIRGTDYTAVFCNGDCTWVPGVSAASPIADGLYLGVTDGTIVFRTSTRTIELTAGEYAFIPLDDPQPQRLDSAPLVLLDDNDLRAGREHGPQPARGGWAQGARGDRRSTRATAQAERSRTAQARPEPRRLTPNARRAASTTRRPSENEN